MDISNKEKNITDNNSGKQDFYFIDTHAHLDMLKKMTPDFAVKESLQENVKFIINVGSSLEGSKKSLEYSKLYNNVFASVGVHPHDAEDFKNWRDRVPDFGEIYPPLQRMKENRDKIIESHLPVWRRKSLILNQ